MRLLLLSAAIALSASACREPVEPEAATRPTNRPPIVQDFGVIPHGEARTVDLEIPIPTADAPVVPVAFRRNCVCASHDFVAIRADGSERIVAPDGVAHPDEAIGDDERLVLRLTIDTSQKEAADVKPSPTPGQIVFQQADNPLLQHRVTVHYSFGIDAPVTIRPAAIVDLGDVPLGTRFTLPVSVRGDDIGIGFGTPTITEPGASGLAGLDDIELRVERDDDGSLLLRVTMEPGPGRAEGPFAAEIRIPTDRADGYVVRIPVRGRITSTIEISEPKTFAFGRIPLDEERDQSLVLTDHAPDRSPEFQVVDIVDGRGQSLAEHFSLELTPIDGAPRARHASLRYLGRLRDVAGFRGEVLLAKEAGGEPVLRIPFSGFQRRDSR